jgi:predicted DCC family thiol-disulfide oxidoreductase YuxK
MPDAGDWTVLYDAECGLCRVLLVPLLRWDRHGRLRPLPLQSAAAETLLAPLSAAERMASWHLLSPTGQRWSAGTALPPLLRLLPSGRGPATLLARFPTATERSYLWVADHRTGLARLIPSGLKRRADYLRLSP